jgi:hypothetical protein
MTKHVDTETLRQRLDASMPVTVLDVRSDDDLAQWAIPGGLHVNGYDALRSNHPGRARDLRFEPDRPVVTRVQRWPGEPDRSRCPHAARLRRTLAGWRHRVVRRRVPDMSARQGTKPCLSGNINTMSELPIVCTLSPDALVARRQGLLALLLQHSAARELLPDGLRLRFVPSRETLSRIAEAVDAERHCCRFLRFTLTVEPDEGPFTLDLTGPDGTREFVAALLDV